MTKSIFRIQIITIILISIMLFGIVPQAVIAAQNIPPEDERIIPHPFEGYDLDLIFILYDPRDEVLTEIAQSVHDILSFRINSVIMFPINSYIDFEYLLTDEPWIAIYALKTQVDGVVFPDRKMSWYEFYQVLHAHPSTHHVVGMGNTMSLASVMPTDDDKDANIRHADSEQIDGMLLILYDVWNVADVIDQRAQSSPKYDRAGKDIRAMAIKMYCDNMRHLLLRSLDPVDPVGEIDPVALEQRNRDMWARHTPTLRPAAYQLTDIKSLVEIPLDQLPDDFHPIVRLSSPANVSPTDYILGEMPLLSALNGPIGKIVDVLLGVLLDEGQSVISIPSDVVETIVEIFQGIEPIIGIVSDFDRDSPLKSIINELAEEFPFIAEYKEYLQIILKALFNLRGDLSSILEIVAEIVLALLPDTIPSEVTDFLSDLLGVGDDLWNEISAMVAEGKGIYDVIFGFFTRNALDAILEKMLEAKFGITSASYLDRLTKFVTAFIDFLTTRDFSRFVTRVGQDLLSSLLGDMTGLQPAVDKIMSVIQLVMGTVNLVDKYDASSVIELVTELLTTFVPSGIIVEAETFAKQLMNVTKTYKEGALSSVTNFRNEVARVIDSCVSGSVPSSTKNLIKDVITLLGGYFNDAFDKNQLPDIFEIAEDIIQQLGLPPTQMGYSLAQETEFINAMNEVVRPILGIIALVTDSTALKQLVSKTVSNFESELGSLPDMIMHAIEYMDLDDLLPPDAEEVLLTVSEVVGGITNIIKLVKGQSFAGIMQSLLMSAAAILGTHSSFDEVPFDALLVLLQSFFPDAFGIDPQSLPSKTEIINTIINYASGKLSGVIDETVLTTMLQFFMNIKGIFTDGVRWLLGMVFDWLNSMLTPVFDELEDSLRDALSQVTDLLGYSTTLPIGLGEWSLFELSISLGLRLDFNIDLTPLFDIITSMIFDARSIFSISNVGDFLQIIFSFFEFTPQFFAELGVSGFDSSKNAILGTLLGMLGMDISFEGSAHFVLNLFTFRNGLFEWENFMKVVEWGLHIKISLSKTFTLVDLFTAGLGGGALAAVMEFLGLDTIKIIIWFAVELDIVKKAATAVAAEVSTLTLAITLGVAINIPIDLIIVAITIYGSMEIILTFFQDFANSDPLKITLRLIFTVRVTFRFLFWDTDASWSWEPGGPWDLSPKKGETEYNKSGVGLDTDDDGLSDEYESRIPGLDPTRPDTDGDGASDKLEVQTMDTDPTSPDTDGDGLLDGAEWESGTNPMVEDTDWDGLTDYQEVNIYVTDPLSQDTDGDRLTDSYEVLTRWDLSVVTPTVEYVVIGGVRYNDHTDPLNPDTDGDGLLDGQEGPMGAYYGLDSLYNDTPGSGFDPAPILFNDGYTHPLDADTDDDSYLQLYSGEIDRMLNRKLVPRGYESQAYPMSDGNEVSGFDIILYDDEGEPYLKHVYTNPVNPDTDGDTGVTAEQRENPPAGAWLNSDGYELQLDPPSDPTDGDCDDDGLLDGLEGVIRQDSNHTFYLDPDTDDDGLPDMVDLLLGTDPLSADTDLDMVSDGDEFYIYGTCPTLPDTDFDGLEDGDELFFWHTNPFADDSDGDLLLDGYEVLTTGSNPMDEDSDNDGLTDFEEFFVYYTDPFVYDSDDDGLSDGEEVMVYFTDPLNWDTDYDSITEPNEYDEMTWPMNDYQEVMMWNTSPTTTDSDMDGLGDAMELYLGGWKLHYSTSPYPTVPWLEPIPLDPNDRDTDDDLLADGAELVITNTSDLIYPFVSFNIILKFNTSPVDRDSDDDLLIDYQEVVVFNTNPVLVDTDNDSISDWWEIWVYNTSALNPDTDGDGWNDTTEVLVEVYPYGPWPPSNWSIGLPGGDNGTPGGFVPAGLPLYTLPPSRHITLALQPIHPTSATDWDSDDDWLPDGAEGDFYHTNPLDKDSDKDDNDDTYEFDTDYDGLPDGIEFMIRLQATGGGILNPDSDFDGLIDGDEYYVYDTDPVKADTDGDGFSDGLEIALGLDPLTYTPRSEFELYLAIMRGQMTMKIMLPKEGAVVYQDLQVSVANFTAFQDMWFRYNNGTGWSQNYSLVYNRVAGQFQSVGHRWPTGNITLQVFGRNQSGIISAAFTHFIVLQGDTPFPWMTVGAIVGGIAVVVIGGYTAYRKGLFPRRGRERRTASTGSPTTVTETTTEASTETTSSSDSGTGSGEDGRPVKRRASTRGKVPQEKE